MKKAIVFISSLLLVILDSGVFSQPSLAEGELTATGPTISSGGDSVCVILKDGAVSCWGPNLYGSANVPTGMPKVTQITAGYYHTCALSELGKVYCWGGSVYPELVAVPSDLGLVVQIDASQRFTCALDISGSVECWGRSIDALRPPADLGLAKQVSVGTDHACVVLETGFVRCWGENNYGQTEIPNDIGQVKKVSAGDQGTCVITADSEVKCWGDKTPWWQPTSTVVPQDLGKVSQLEMGWITCAINTEELVRCWGHGLEGSANGMTRTSQISVDEKLATLSNDGSVRVAGGWNCGCWDTPSSLGPVLGSAPELSRYSQPTLVGSPFYGGELAVDTGVWDEGTTFTYQWFRNDEYINYASSDIYTPNLQDVGKRLSVKVTGSKFGHKSVIMQSEPLLVQLCDLPEDSKPTISSSADLVGLGDTLQASGVICAGGLVLSYQWLRGNKNIPKGTNSIYKVQYEDLSSELRLKVSAAFSGQLLGSWVSDEVKVKYLKMAGLPCPKLKTSGNEIALDKDLILKRPKGHTFPGQVLKSDFGTWPAKTKVCYFWLVGNNPPESASSGTYSIKMSDVGRSVVGIEIGTDLKGESTARVTKPVRITLAEFRKVQDPLINDTWFIPTGKYYFLPNKLLIASRTKWSYFKVKYKYAWHLDGKVVSRSLSYTPHTRDVGKYLWFEVCGSKFGYKTKCLATLPTKIINAAPKPPGPVHPTPRQCNQYRVDIATKQAAFERLKPSDWESWMYWDSRTALAYFLNKGDIGGASDVTRLTQEINVTHQLLIGCR